MENYSISFVIDGEVVPWKRTRAKTHKVKDKKSGKEKTTVHFFEDKKVSDYKEKVVQAYRESGGRYFDKDTPLKCDVTIFTEVPKSSSHKKKLSLIRNFRPTKRPDNDNLYKGITDALNKVAYYDDSQIVDTGIHKFWSNNPRAEVTLTDISVFLAVPDISKDLEGIERR